MTVFYSPKRYYSKDAPLARLYVVSSPLGSRVYARKSVDSESPRVMRLGFLFHGTPSTDKWVRILGGGWCTGLSVREVV